MQEMRGKKTHFGPGPTIFWAGTSSHLCWTSAAFTQVILTPPQKKTFLPSPPGVSLCFVSFGAVFSRPCEPVLLCHSQFLLSCSTKKGPKGTRRMIDDFSRAELSIFTVRETAQSQEKSSRMPGNMCLLVLVFSQRKQRSPGRKSSIGEFF